MKSFTDRDDYYNYCCLTASALLHHAAIFFINQSGIFCHRNVNQEVGLYDRSLRWGLAYNLDKCVATRITRKRNSSLPSLAVSPYEARGHAAFAVVSSQKDFEGIITDKLTWSSHIEWVATKANQMLGFLCLSFFCAF